MFASCDIEAQDMLIEAFTQLTDGLIDNTCKYVEDNSSIFEKSFDSAFSNNFGDFPRQKKESCC